MTHNTPIKVVLVDDHEIVRQGFRKNLELNSEADIEIIGEAGDGKEAVEAYKKFKPDVVVMDLSMPVLGGRDALKLIIDYDQNAKVVVFSVNENALVANRIFEAGAKGYLSKSSAGQELVEAITTVAAGNIFISPEIARMLGESKILGEVDPVERLSKRELQVFRLTAEGNSPSEIAKLLDLGVTTVNGNLTKIKHKLGIGSSVEIARLAIRIGLIDA